MRSPRGQAIAGALRRMMPAIPDRDLAAVVDHALGSRGLATASSEAAAWLSAVAYIRHSFTDYDAMLAEGYDPEAARHFCVDAIDAVLADWGCRRRVGDGSGDGMG